MDVQARILIVDDYRTMLRIIRNLLNQLGFEDVEEVADVQAAFQRLKVVRFDLVIAEWNMEPVSGRELLRQVRADPDLQRLPVIMITADGSDARVAAANKAGANGFIVKPFSAQVLKSRIQHVLCA